MAYVTLDHRWFIVQPGNTGIVYTLPGDSAREAWDNFLKADEPLGTGMTMKLAKRAGYRARMCEVIMGVPND